ncbi:MAG: hypothetical protein HWE20_08845 [Gammaproteobacteria bacterium]|nr:hypothetical protein [Gammaproteobacteria bacterium]
MKLGYKLVTALVTLGLVSTSLAASWEYRELIDGFTDKDNSTISLTDEATNKAISSGSEALFFLKCFDSGIGLAVFHGYMSGDSDDQVTVEMRVDKNGPYGPSYWNLATGSKASFMPDTDLENYIQQLKAGNSVIIRVRDPFDGDMVQGAMPLDGFAAAYEKLSCRI